MSDTGHRCEARRGIEFDHVDPVARGGQATVLGIRLLCRAHNQHAAERTFGVAFMNGKRKRARRATAEAPMQAVATEAGPRSRSRALAETQAHGRAAGAPSRAIANQHTEDLMACLRELGFRPGEVRLAVERCESDANASLEEQVRSALRLLSPKAAARCSATPLPAP